MGCNNSNSGLAIDVQNCLYCSILAAALGYFLRIPLAISRSFPGFLRLYL